MHLARALSADILRRIVLRAGVTVALAAALGSCGASRVAGPGDIRLNEKLARAAPVRVIGYTTMDDRYHHFPSYVTLTGDSMILTRPAIPPVGLDQLGGMPESVMVLPRDEVRSLKLHEGVSGPRTMGLVLIIGVILVGSAAIAIAAQGGIF